MWKEAEFSKEYLVSTEQQPEILISIDGEFTGPNPELHSMVSLGAVAYDWSGRELSRIKVNMHELPGATQDKETMRDFWDDHPMSWNATFPGRVPASDGMNNFRLWLNSLSGKPKLMGWPIRVDHLWFSLYWWKFLKTNPPYGWDGIDIKTYAMVVLGLKRYSDVDMVETAKLLGMNLIELPHIPDQDAAIQAEIFFRLRAYKASHSPQ